MDKYKTTDDVQVGGNISPLDELLLGVFAVALLFICSI